MAISMAPSGERNAVRCVRARSGAAGNRREVVTISKDRHREVDAAWLKMDRVVTASATRDEPELVEKSKHLTLQSSTGETRAVVLSHLPSISKDVRLLGALTAFTTAVIIGMSVYIVQEIETEVSLDENGGRLLAKNGNTMITATEEHEVPTLAELVRLSDDEMRRVEKCRVEVPEHSRLGVCWNHPL